MISAKLDEDYGTLHVHPSGPLEEADFLQLATLADPYIERTGQLPGLLIELDDFPGWKNLAGMLQHFRFVRDHHKKISKVALVTDSNLGEMAEKLAGHFVAATVRHFAPGELDDAREWIISPGEIEQ